MDSISKTRGKQKKKTAVATQGTLPRRHPGRQSPEATAQYWAAVEQFAAVIRQIASGLDFKPSSRGWCYILEGMHYLTKADFEACFRLINDCRKRGILPLDIACEDDKRQFENLEELTDDSAEEFALAYVRGLAGVPEMYAPFSFWENQRYYLQMLTEKIDLKELFKIVCARFHIPIANAGGWGDLHVRANMMQRFKYWKKGARRPCCSTVAISTQADC